jgi:hypothetical protein
MSVGYTLPGQHIGFSVEKYKGEWIARVSLPGDQDASGNPNALAAIQMWLDVGARKFQQAK